MLSLMKNVKETEIMYSLAASKKYGINKETKSFDFTVMQKDSNFK